MNDRPELDRVMDPDDDWIDPRKARIRDEIRRLATADADRAFQKVRDDLRRLVREYRGSE